MFDYKDRTNVPNEICLEMLNLLEKKPKIKVIIFEKTKIEENIAKSIANKIKFEISNYQKELMSI